jgi:phytoene synthase
MQDAFAHCEALVRTADKDRFLATLFAPAERRGALHALYAFNIEIARVREIVREPLAGEIRLQWWSDALAGTGAGDVKSNPVADALLATIERHRLPNELLTALIEARRFDLYSDPMQRLGDLEAYGRATASALIELAARILADPDTPGTGTPGTGTPATGQLALAAGLGYAISSLLVSFPLHAGRGQLYLPVEVLERHGVGRDDIAAGHASPGLRAAFAELCLRAREHLARAAGLVARIFS